MNQTRMSYDRTSRDADAPVVLFVELGGDGAAERLGELARALGKHPKCRHTQLLVSLDQPLHLLVSEWNEVPNDLETPSEARVWRFRAVSKTAASKTAASKTAASKTAASETAASKTAVPETAVPETEVPKTDEP